MDGCYSGRKPKPEDVRGFIQKQAVEAVRRFTWLKAPAPTHVYLVGATEYEMCLLAMDSAKWGPHLEGHKGPSNLEAVALLMWAHLDVLESKSGQLKDQRQGHIFLWIDSSGVDALFWGRKDIAFRPQPFNDFAPDFLNHHVSLIPGAKWPSR